MDTLEMPSRTQSDPRVARGFHERPGGPNSVRVLHVISYFGRGGTEMGVLKLVKGLGPEFEHRICTTRGFDRDFARSHFSEDRMEMVGTPDAGLQFPLFRLVHVMRRYRPHIVHTRNWGGIEAVLAAKLAGVPAIVHSEHGYELDMLRGLPFRRRVFRRCAYSLAARFFAVTSQLRDFHARQAWISPDRIGVLHNGVDTDHFSPSETVRASVREKFALPPECCVLGSVGRLVSIKDHQSLLRAASMLVQSGLDVRVLLVGSGPERGALETEAARFLGERARFIGDSSQVSELLNAMDVFALPSLAEGMSNTLLEAMSCGKAVVATAVGGNPEILENRTSGILIAPGDTQALFEELKVLVVNSTLRNQLGSAARQRMLDSFSLSRMLKEYRQLYFQMLDDCPAIPGLDAAHVRN